MEVVVEVVDGGGRDAHRTRRVSSCTLPWPDGRSFGEWRLKTELVLLQQVLGVPVVAKDGVGAALDRSLSAVRTLLPNVIAGLVHGGACIADAHEVETAVRARDDFVGGPVDLVDLCAARRRRRRRAM